MTEDDDPQAEASMKKMYGYYCCNCGTLIRYPAPLEPDFTPYCLNPDCIKKMLKLCEESRRDPEGTAAKIEALRRRRLQ